MAIRFDLRPSIPTTEGGFGPGQNITLPKLRGSPWRPPVEQWKAVASIGQTIQGWGAEILARDRQMKTAKLYSDVSIEAAEYEKTISVDDYGKRAEMVGDWWDKKTKEIEKRGREIGIGPEQGQRLGLLMSSGKTTAVTGAIQEALRQQKDATITHLSNLADRAEKTVEEYGLNHAKSKEALHLYHQQLQNSVQILGEVEVAKLGLNMNTKAEEKSFDVMVSHDPQTFLAMYGPGGSHKSKYTARTHVFVDRARRRVKTIEASQKEENSLARAAIDVSTSSFISAAGALTTDTISEAITNHIFIAAEIQSRIDAVRRDSVGKSTENKTAIWAAKQLGRVDAAKALVLAMSGITTAELGKIEGFVEDFQAGMTDAFGRSGRRSVAEMGPEPLPQKGPMRFSSIEEARTYDNAYGTEAKKHLNQLVLFGKDRNEQINRDQRNKNWMSGAAAGTQNPEAIKDLNEGYWDQPLDRDSREVLGLTKDDPGIIRRHFVSGERFFNTENPSLAGDGPSMMRGMFLQTGLLPPWFIEKMEGHLRDPGTGPANVKRSSVVRMAHEFSLENPSVFDAYSPELQSAVEHFRLSGGLGGQEFGEAVRIRLSEDPVHKEMVEKADAAIEGWDFGGSLERSLGGWISRSVRELAKLRPGDTWGMEGGAMTLRAGPIVEGAQAVVGAIARGIDDPSVRDPEETDERTGFQKTVNYFTRNFFATKLLTRGEGYFPEDTSPFVGDITEANRYNIARIEESYRTDVYNELLTGSSKTLNDAIKIVDSRMGERISIENWGNPGNDMTIQHLSPANDIFNLGTDQQIAQQFSDIVNEAIGDTFGKFDLPTPEDFLNGTWRTVPSRTRMTKRGERTSGYLWEVWGPDGGPLLIDGRKVLVQPEVDSTRQMNALRRAAATSGGNAFFGGTRAKVLIEALGRIAPWRTPMDPDLDDALLR